MKIEFSLSNLDIKKSYFEYLFLSIKKIIPLYFLLSILIAWILSYGNQENQMNWSSFFIFLFIVFSVICTLFILIPAVINFYKISKHKKTETKGFLSVDKIILENTKSLLKVEYEWDQIQKFSELKNYYTFFITKRNYIIVPKKIINSTDLDFIQSKIPKNSGKNKNSIPNWLYFINLIPNIGLISGIAFLIAGIINLNKKIIIWGVVGMLLTPLFWFVTISFLEKTGNLNSDFSAFSQMRVNEFVKELEYYKVKNGELPEDLYQLKQQMKFFDDSDPSTNEVIPWRKQNVKKIYYKKISDSTYVLKSVGKDKLLNTKDDIYPTLK